MLRRQLNAFIEHFGRDSVFPQQQASHNVTENDALEDGENEEPFVPIQRQRRQNRNQDRQGHVHQESLNVRNMK